MISHFLLLDSSMNHFLAYIDGGTGSMVLQAAIAGVLSAAYVAKTRWAQLKAFVSARTNKPSTVDGA